MDTLMHPVMGNDNGSAFPQANAWARPAAKSLVPNKNVGDSERLMSAVGGVALAFWGLSRFSTLGVLAAGLGAALIYRGSTGHCLAYEALGLNTVDETSDSAISGQQCQPTAF
jgi:uncharacterized membrane protein